MSKAKAATAVVKTKTKAPKGWLKKYGSLYIIALPALIVMLVYKYIPMVGILLSFTDFQAGMALDRVEFIGFKWFEMIFTGGDFMHVLGNTIYLSLLKIVFSFPAPIIIAIFMNEMLSVKFKRTVQTAMYLPHFISWTILSGIIFSLLSTQVGITSFFGITESLLLNESFFRPLLIVTDIWKSCGWGSIVYLAAITSISPELYEAAMIDGAGRFQRIWHITLPSIAGTIIILLILRIGNILDAGFDQVFMLSNDAVIDVADIIDTYTFRIGMQQGRFALATAAGLFKSVVGLILVIIANKAAKMFREDAGLL